LEAGLAAFSPPPSHPTLFLMLRCPHCPSLPRLEQPVRAQNRRFHGLEKCPGPSSTASARERHQPPTLARRQPASRAAPLGALGRRSAMRSPAGAGRGGCRSLRSILTGAWSAAAAMVGAEPSSSAAAVAAAAAAAAVGPLSRRRVWRGGDGAASGRCESRREAAVERAMAGREAAGAAATRAGACTTAVKVQRARARAFLLM